MSNSRTPRLRLVAKTQAPFALCLLLFSAVPSPAQEPLPSFSAEVTHTVRGETSTGRIYFDGHSIRMETGGPGLRTITILRLDSNVKQVWWLPEEKYYIEQPYLAGANPEFARYLPGATAQSESMGTETVGDYRCERYRVRVSYKGDVYSSLEWRAAELGGLVVKSQGEKAEWLIEYRNIRRGEQPSTLFESPAGYQKVSYSQDWTEVLHQIQLEPLPWKKVSMAQKAGLKVIADAGTLPTENVPLADETAIRYLDPVTGSLVMQETIHVDHFPVRPLPAPELISPPNGSVFDTYPRRTELRWKAVPGAASYGVQVDLYYGADPKKSPWASENGIGFIRTTTKDLSYTFDFAGAQPGRWRVWAVDMQGNEGIKSDWSTFRYTH